jgi:hypothetical protein
MLLGLVLAFLIQSAPGVAGADETKPNRTEYQLLRKMPRPILTQMMHDELGQISLGRGSCKYLIAAVVLGDKEHADDAWKSIEATFAQQDEDGGLKGGGRPGDLPFVVYEVRVENMYFFLQELGHALLVVQASPMASYFHDRIEAIMPSLRKACDFIQKGSYTIIPKVGHTVNRTIIAAKAFGLCGLVLHDDKMLETSNRLVKFALTRRDQDGIFIENGGRDSSYNCVSMLFGTHLLLYIPHPDLDAAFKPAIEWERTRVQPTGEIAVTGNTRTGVGKEANSSGVPKGVNYPEVAQTFWYYGMLHHVKSDIDLAVKIDEYRRTAHK